MDLTVEPDLEEREAWVPPELARLLKTEKSAGEVVCRVERVDAVGDCASGLTA